MKIVTVKGNVGMHDYVDKILRPQGWKYAGSGAYGTVYAKGDAAIKIGYVRGNKGYLRYIEAMNDVPDDNPTKPVISELTYVETPAYQEEFFIVMMEKLKPIHWEDESDADYLSSVIRSLSYGHGGPEEIQDLIKKLKKKRSEQRGIMQLMVKIAELVKDGYGLDLHCGNVMVRASTNEIVVTDPLV